MFFGIFCLYIRKFEIRFPTGIHPKYNRDFRISYRVRMLSIFLIFPDGQILQFFSPPRSCKNQPTPSKQIFGNFQTTKKNW